MTPTSDQAQPPEDGYDFSSEPLLNPEPPAAEAEPAAAAPPATLDPVETHGALHLIGRDPRWLFLFWDRDESPLPVSCEHIEIRISTPNGSIASTRRAQAGETHWLLPAPAPGGSFFAEIGWFAPDVGWRLLARSPIAQTAPDGPSADESAAFGLLPFSLAFDRLKALAAMAELRGLSLPELLARITEAAAAEPAAPSAPSAPEWTPEQRALLQTLLDDLSIERFAGDSSAVERLFRRGLQEIAVSEEELFSRERWDHLLRLAGGSALEGGS